MRALELRSHDCNEQRVYRYLCHLCRVDGRISQLTTLHLTFQCSEQVLIRIMKYLVPLQELVLSIAHPSPSWQNFLESLAAKPSAEDWPAWDPFMGDRWGQWCSSQTWHANIVPRLKYLGIQCPKGFSHSECLETSPILRLVGWTRAWLTPPLEHLKVWEGRGTTDAIVVDYSATDYLDKHLGVSNKGYDGQVVRGMVTQCLVIYSGDTPLILQLHATVLFRRLQELTLCYGSPNNNVEILILPCLTQIKRLDIFSTNILADHLKSDSPLMDTLQWLALYGSAYSWMLGRTFKALREFMVEATPNELEYLSRREGLQVGLPACTILKLQNCSEDCLHLFSCPNVQFFRFDRRPVWRGISEAAFKCLINFLCDCPRLQELEIHILENSRHVDSLMEFIFVNAREQAIWRDIRSVEVTLRLIGAQLDNDNRFLASVVGNQQHYEKWWKEFTVTQKPGEAWVTVRASR